VSQSDQLKDCDRPLEKSRLIVFDTELTGLNPRRDEIVSIGAVVVENLRIIPEQSFYSIIRPEGIGKASTATFIHRLTPENLTDGPVLEDVLNKFLEFCGNSILVGHQLQIDRPFILRACKQVTGYPVTNAFVDTIQLARRCRTKLFPSESNMPHKDASYNLGFLARRLGLPLFRSHDALGDALQTSYLLLKLICLLKAEGISTCRELCVLGSPTWFQSCRFRWGMERD
jgi:DNA polymerase III subunit epsilon